MLFRSHPFLNPDRGTEGYLDGKNHERKPYHFTTGDLSHREYADLLKRDGLILGRTSITNSMAPGTKDCSPVPTDSVCIQHRRMLMQDLNPTDTLIYIDDPTYLNEIACWEGHCPELNMVKIGKELIHYMGVTDTKPYRLKRWSLKRQSSQRDSADFWSAPTRGAPRYIWRVPRVF